MRLINTETLESKEFVEPPPYAILSHCWGDDEVSFKEYSKGRNKDGAGYKKIRECCDFARSRKQKWIWIDTCCIDKRSSAELSEAINSMYKWYRDATECYAYLADVSSATSTCGQRGKEFRYSRWFTRGWTLQELIAPYLVVFLASDWTTLGEKRIFPFSHGNVVYTSMENHATTLVDTIARITDLPEHLLCDGKTNLSDFPAVLRFSWLRGRDTTRPEDLAYCMLGLLEMNMPLLYGEGRAKAVERLQLEVLRTTGDESLFCRQHLDGRNLTGIDLLMSYASSLGVLADVVRMSIHDRPPLTISSNCIEMRMTHGRRGVFYHCKLQSFYVIRLNCVSMAKHTTASPCVMFVRRAGCRPDHFIRVACETKYMLRGSIYVNTEDDIGEPVDWMPRESDETIYIHLHPGNVANCLSDPRVPSDIVFRLRHSN